MAYSVWVSVRTAFGMGRPALGEPSLDVLPGEGAGIACIEHRGSSRRLGRPQPIDLVGDVGCLGQA